MIQADGADFWADRSSVPRTFGLACVPPELFSSPRFSVEWCQRWRAGLSLAVSGGAPDNSLSCREYAILDKSVARHWGRAHRGREAWRLFDTSKTPLKHL